MDKIERILFICLGNINRSPAAEFLWKEIMDTEVQSAGFLKNNMKISKKMREILIKNNFNKTEVEEHRSKIITKKLVSWATVIYCMSESHRDRIIKQFPKARRKTKILSHLIGKKSIKDPGFSSDIRSYQESFEDIKEAISKISKGKTRAIMEYLQ